MRPPLLLLALLIHASMALAASKGEDQILNRSVDLNFENTEEFFQNLQNDLTPIVENFQVQLDNSSRIVSKKWLLGTRTEPVMQVSVKKCVLLICKTIDLDAEFKLLQVIGPCEHNYQLDVDLRRSSPLLTNLYSKMLADICATKTNSGSKLKLKVILIHAGNYKSGVIQETAFSLISLQAEGIWKSVLKTLGPKF